METILEEVKEQLNTKEVAQMLGVTEQTIYNYVKSGELKPLNADWAIDGTYYFQTEAVEKLRVHFEKPGLDTKEVADRLGVTINTVAKYIKQGKLKGIKQEYRGKERYFITEEDLSAFMSNHFVQRDTRQVIFMPDTKYHLYQLFIHPETKIVGRLLEIGNRQEGWLVTENGERIAVNRLNEAGFKPMRTIDKVTPSTKKGYAVFQIPKPHHVKSHLYKILDMLFWEAGAQNLKVAEIGDNIKVEVKPILLEKETAARYEEELDLLARYIVAGKVEKRPGGMLINSNVKSIQAYVDEGMKKDLLEIAAKQEITLEELVAEMLKEGLSRYRSQSGKDII
ncbi:helix-turn-helix domain-containing protein [Aneurinibacillus tyrosinisolvens]|uniref:helix-turn-helix domain-containing protein n=1 Tax=Aneurinibacillus tyrosinisolvens TaxID=1443435 RepID=UPI00069B0923|nr:helix-turn-helix domain-containing protein [Aneurinibacillus tyrosinisolvens]